MNFDHIYNTDISDCSIENEISFTARELFHRIDAGWVQLLNYPILPLKDIAVSCPIAQICLRWIPEEHENTTPGSFFTMLEQSGLMGITDRWVIQRVCNLLLKKHQQSAADNTTFPDKYLINLSLQSVFESETGDHIKRTLDANNISGAGLCFEISLPTALNYPHYVIKLAQKLKSAGCSLVISGTPDVEELLWAKKYLNVQYLKIDFGSVNSNESCITALKQHAPLIESCKRLKIKCIAQHLDVLSQVFVDMLVLPKMEESGCHYVQGYGLAMPSLLDTPSQMHLSESRATLN